MPVPLNASRVPDHFAPTRKVDGFREACEIGRVLAGKAYRFFLDGCLSAGFKEPK